MNKLWLDERAQRAFSAAVAQIEATSCVEVAIAVRRSARSWPQVPVLVGMIAAWAMLAFMLFSEPAFPLWSFLVDPLIAAVAAGGMARRTPTLTRWLTSPRARRMAVLAAARATFVERGVHRTRSRTGVLVYCAVAERQTTVVADDAVAAAVSASGLEAWEYSITEAMARGGESTAHAVAAIASTFASALPRAADDTNELADEIEHDFGRRPRA